MEAPALRASSTSSKSDSRSGTPACIPRTRGERFQATPTRSARSEFGTACGVFMIDHRESLACIKKSGQRVPARRVYAAEAQGGKPWQCRRIARGQLAGFDGLSESDKISVRRQNQQFALAISLIGRAVDVGRWQGIEFGLELGVECVNIAYVNVVSKAASTGRRGSFAALFQNAHARGFTMDVGVIARAKLGFKAQNVVEEFQCGFKVWHVHERGDLDEVGHICNAPGPESNTRASEEKHFRGCGLRIVVLTRIRERLLAKSVHRRNPLASGRWLRGETK